MADKCYGPCGTPIMADEEEQPLEISWRDLSASALDSLIEEFVTRDGTDYGAQEKDLASRKRDVRRWRHGARVGRRVWPGHLLGRPGVPPQTTDADRCDQPGHHATRTDARRALPDCWWCIYGRFR